MQIALKIDIVPENLQRPVAASSPTPFYPPFLFTLRSISLKDKCHAICCKTRCCKMQQHQQQQLSSLLFLLLLFFQLLCSCWFCCWAVLFIFRWFSVCQSSASTSCRGCCRCSLLLLPRIAASLLTISRIRWHLRLGGCAATTTTFQLVVAAAF